MRAHRALTKARLAALAAAVLLCGSACLFDSGQRHAGGSSETTNGIVIGFVQNPNGAPAVGVQVTMLPQGWLADTSGIGRIGVDPDSGIDTARLVTDAQGRFYVDSVLPGGYLFEARDSASRLAVLFSAGLGHGDTIALEPKRLLSMATIEGRVTLDSAAGNGFVRIFGLNRVRRVDPGTGAFAFNDLPPGIYSLEVTTERPVVDAVVLPGVAAQAASTTQLPPVILASFEGENYSAWPYTRRIYLNTTSSGANVPGTVTNFPVLVRLDRSNFDFSQSSGRDIRFSKPDGTHLRYELEHWDSVAGMAAVWVKVDVIPGNSNQLYINLLWGAQGVSDGSSGRHVFDTADGFAGVWHLREEAADTTSDRLYLDATAGAAHGDDRITSSSSDGVVGPGKGFNAFDYLRVRGTPLLKPQRQFTVSAWFKASSVDSLGSDIATLGQSYGIRISPTGAPTVLFSQTDATSSHVSADAFNVLDSAWHQMTGWYDGKTMVIFLDGVEGARREVPGSINFDHGPDFLLGRHGDLSTGFNFTGSMDEIQVSRVSRSPDWIKLSFENQRLNATLVEFR